MAEAAVQQEAATEEARREAWLDARRRHITATDIGKILGRSRFGGPTMVYLDKIGEVERGPETERQRWGKWLEEAILRGFAERRGVAVEMQDPYALIEAANDPLLAASLDGVVMPDGLPVDAKNIRHPDPALWGEEDTDQVPDEYLLQMATQMLVLDKPEAYLAALFGGQELRVYRFHRDSDIDAVITSSAHDFHDRYVVPRIAPPPDGSEAYSAQLQKRLRQTSERLLDADEVTRSWAAVLKDARKKAEEIAKVQEEAEQNIKEAIGSALGVVGPGFRVTWKQAKPTEKVNHEGAEAALVAMVRSERGEEEAAWLLGLIAKAKQMNLSEKAGPRRFLPTFTEEE